VRRTCPRVWLRAVAVAIVLGWMVGPAAARQTSQEQTRESWQRVADIFTALGATPGAVIADVGAGSGFFTERLAKAVGSTGRVFAVDVDANALRRLQDRIRSSGLTNVETVHGAADDPKLPAGTLDGALIINAYHEMVDYHAMLTHIRAALKPSGRLVIVEPISEASRDGTRESQTRRHQIAARFVQDDARAAGFRIVGFEEPFARRPSHDHEYMVVLAPGDPPPSGGASAPTAHTHEAGGRPDRYETASRLAWQRPDEIVKALELRPGQMVADIGAGSGIMTRRFAVAVAPSGQAIGLDIDPAMVDFMIEDARARKLANYSARLVTREDAGMARASVDLVFLMNTFHMMQNRVTYFARLRPALKPEGRVVLVDMPPGGFGPGSAADNPTLDQVRAEFEQAGYRLTRSWDFLLPRQFFVEFRPVAGR
jgi:arsenite methyltransferase